MFTSGASLPSTFIPHRTGEGESPSASVSLRNSLIHVSYFATEAYATKFIEMILMVTADHGPAVSGAHNTIVTARAGRA